MHEIKINDPRKRMIICPDCGTGNEEGSEFCIECGTKLNQEKTQSNQINCPKCGTLNRPGAEFCSECGRNLFGKKTKKKKKRKLAKKAYRGSKGLLKSAHKQGIRRTVKKETWYVLRKVDTLSGGKLRKMDETIQHSKRSQSNPQGYLICDRCSGYYELKPGISPEKYKVCTCGGKLSYSRNLR